MPYIVVKQDDEYCVYKKDEDGEPVGDTLGCHDTEQEAEEQLKALYANEDSSARQMERRYCQGELRAIEEDGKRKIVGYAAKFSQMSEDLGGWREIIEPGSFDDVLGDDVRALFNHDPNLVLGRTPDTLALGADSVGLRYEIEPPDTQYARDLLVSLDRGDIDQSSFAWVVREQSWEEPTEDRPYAIRHLLKFERLYDVSPVTFPAYPTTSAEARDTAQSLASRGQEPGGDEDKGAARRLAERERELRLTEIE